MASLLKFELVDPKHTALLVIDPQYVFCMEYLPNGEKTPLAKMSDAAGVDPPAYDFSSFPRVLTKLQSLLETARSTGVMIIYTQATRLLEARPTWTMDHLAKIYRVDTNKVTIPNFAIHGTPDWEFVEQIKPQEGDVVIQKSRQSAFVGTPIELVLKNNGIKTLIFTGCETDCCVEATLRDAAFGYDYLCVLLEDCITSFNIEMHEAQMKINKRHFDVLQSEELIQLWQSQK